MEQVVIDASVVAKWFIEEKDTDKALQVRDLYLGEEISLTMPVLILFELGNVLRKHPLLSIEDSERALEAFLDLKIELRSFAESALLKEAYRVSKDLDITFYDASYVALARLHKIAFLTGDQELYDKAKGSINVVLLTNFEPGKFLI